MMPPIEFVSTQRSGQVQHVAQRLQGASSAALYAGYRRHTEFDAGDHAGQDWCGLRVFGSACVAVVADGVSQSFMGDIAARTVGRGLLDALSHEGESALHEPRCHALLEQLRATTQREVDAFALSDAVPDFLRAALEAKRTSSGTQTVVAAAFVDLATGRGRLLLVGDISVVVHRRSGPPAVIAGDRRARWSNLHGLRGAVVNEALEDVTGIVLASDGMPSAFGLDRAAFGDEARIDQTVAAGAERDDASFVAMLTDALTDAPHASRPAPLPVPATVLGEPPQAPYLAPVEAPTGSPRSAPRSPYAQQPPAQPLTSEAPPPRPPRRWRTILGLVLVATGLAAAVDRVVEAFTHDALPQREPIALAPEQQRKRPPAPRARPPRTLPLNVARGAPPPNAPRPVHLDASGPAHDAALDVHRDDVSAAPQPAHLDEHHHHHGSESPDKRP